MNLYHIILIINILYILNYFYQSNRSNQYLQKINYESDYVDEFNKIKNKISIEIYNTITKSDNDIFEYEFQINCYKFLDNILCNEYIQLKYNMTLNEFENQIIEYMYYFFKDITIIKKQQYNCCNTYQLYW